MKFRLSLGIALSVLSAGLAAGQSKTTGVLRGIVTDATDAAVPGAKVTVTGSESGVVLAAVTTDERGEYLVPLAPPVKVEKPGFSVQVSKGIGVTEGQTAVTDVKLNVGSNSQVVEVQANAPLLETERTQQSNTIEQRAVRNLPINRRDYLSFSLLAPGVSDSKAMANSNSFRVKQTPDSGLSFYGSNGRGNNISVDGGEFNDAGGGVRPTVSQEAVQEFQINRTDYSAEHGQARGRVVNIITKGGGNAVRGDVFGFFRHQSLDAADPFALVLNSDNTVSRIKPDSQRQQFGGTLGGPIVKDRTFYFLSYEQLRRRESNAVPVLTDLSIFQPTAAQQAILATLPADAAGRFGRCLAAGRTRWRCSSATPASSRSRRINTRD